jgi:hypothetical protein
MTNKALLQKIAAELIKWSEEEKEITYDDIQVFCNSLTLKDKYHKKELWRVLDIIKGIIEENK